MADNSQPNVGLSRRAKNAIAACALVGAVFGVVSANPSLRIEFWKRVNPNRVLRIAATQINRDLPKQVDPVTRWDRSVALPDLTMRYEYTLTEFNGDADAMTHTLKPKLIDAYRRLDDMRVFREIGATLIFYYSDADGNEITSITIPAKML